MGGEIKQACSAIESMFDQLPPIEDISEKNKSDLEALLKMAEAAKESIRSCLCGMQKTVH